MTEPTLIIANMQYKTPRRTRRGQGIRGLKSTLKYLQFRDDREHLTQEDKRQRWVDCGLGSSHKEILENCIELKSRHVLAWTWVISPEPDVMALVPEDQRHRFLQELTEAVVERYYEERGFTPEYAYVVHHAQTQDGRPHTHSHIVLPGTVESSYSGREDMVNYKSKGHLQALDTIANEELELILDKHLGHEWNQQLRFEYLGDIDR